MPAVTFDVSPALIAGAGATSCDGQAVESVTEAASGINSAMLIGATLYAVVATGAFALQVYRSTDDGATWATYGATAAPTAHGGGMCVFAKGTDLWVSYTAALAAFSEIVYLRAFDTLLGTWGSEATVNALTLSGGAATITRPEGPYAGYARLDGSIVLLVGGTVGNPDVWALVFSAGSFTAAAHFSSAGVGSEYSSSFIAPDDTIHVFYVSDVHTRGYHQYMLADNSVSVKVALPTGLLDWNDTGVNWGFIRGSTIYLGVGINTSEVGIYGRAAIVSGSDSGWSTTAALDTDVAVADYSLYSGILVESNGYLIFVCRLVSSAGTHYIIRAGFVPSGAFATPASWTWSTIYDLASPSPAVPGETGAYLPIASEGANSALTVDAAGVFRYVTTLNGTEQFVALLFSVAAAMIGNSFSCGRSYLEQGA